MKFTSNNFTVTGTSKHSSGRSYSHTDKFYKNYKDSDFPSWSRGTFPNKVRSLDYHIGKHGTEVGTQNILKYYGLALTERRNAIVGGKTKYVVSGDSRRGSVKYTRKAYPRRYILLQYSSTSSPIFSFGGK